MRPHTVIVRTLLLVGLFTALSHQAVWADGDDAYAGTAEEKASLIKTINTKRMAIEARKGDLTRHELSTASLREQIKQKWSKLDFYADGESLVRVKTYPHKGISARTEEFYFEDGELIFAIIQDKGEAAAESGEGAAKQYFYSDGKFVGEVNETEEEEQSIRHSDEERLEAEAMEYIRIFKAHFTGKK